MLLTNTNRQPTTSMLRSARAVVTRQIPLVASPATLRLRAPLLQLARGYAAKDFPPHTVIDMPALSPTMEQGNVGKWNKNTGDKLSVGDPLVEIETDKAVMDFEFQEDGYLAKQLIPEGTKDVAVGTPLGVYVEEQDSVPAFESFTIDDAGGLPAKAAKEEPAEEPKEESKSESKPAAEEKPKSSGAAAPSAPPAGRIFASPLAKMIALDKGIKLSDVKGTGPNGRIIKRDAENFKPAAPAAAAAGPEYVDAPISNMRGTIAKRLTNSKQTNPDFIVSSQVSVSKLLELRKSLNEQANGEYKISLNDILIKAIALANKKVPAANSAWIESEKVIRTYNAVDVSVAVATPTGLITPVIRGADTLGLSAISQQSKELVKKARDGKLAPEQYQGGTITISNMGMNPAVSIFTAIINPPQSVIVAIGTTERKAVEDPLAENGISFDDVITITGTFDHKVVDGAVGGEWIKALKNILENPLKLLL